jgi:hypothetical protein
MLNTRADKKLITLETISVSTPLLGGGWGWVVGL